LRTFRPRRREISDLKPLEYELQFESDSGDTLGGRLVSAREAIGLSTAQLARRTGVKTESLSYWENDRDEPRANRLVTLAGVLNVSPTWLLCGIGDGPSDSLTSTEMMKIRSTIERLRQAMIVFTEELENIEQRLECYNSHQD
jgi:transcriptional regulator with XRE-family HTH domain